MTQDEVIRAAAADWAVRIGSAGFDDWEGFTAWLEESPDHALAYDRVAAGVADAVDILPPVAAADEPEEAQPRGRPRRWMLGALAAAVAAGGVGMWQWADPGGYMVMTKPGETRTIALADGGSVVLAGGSRIELYHDAPRRAAMEQGSAYFTIRHDADDPFRVRVGDNRLVDIGTRFEVQREGDAMQVAVAEGAVAFNPRGQNVRLNPGDMLSSEGGQRFSVTRVPVAEIGEWRDGRLSFQDRPLPEIAARLSAMTGVAFRVAPGAAQRRLSGSVAIDSVRDDPAVLGDLFGIAVARSGDSWVIG